MSDKVILLDTAGNHCGSAEKMEAHREGRLHQAFSVFILDSAGRMLLQKRGRGKYHSAGLWTNACCSHPRPGEELLAAARRRLNKEMGFDTDLKEIFTFTYQVTFEENGLTEHENDHVLLGTFDGTPKPDPDEVDEYRWVEPGELLKEATNSPDHFTHWFKLALERVLIHCGLLKKN